MISVTIGTNLKRQTVDASPTDTLKSVLDAHGIDYTKGMMNLDGAPLAAGELNKTFADFGVSTDGATCFLLNVVKADNAA